MPHYLEIALWILFFVMSVVIHEVCHGVVAGWLGDPTAKNLGRLTLNPIRHIDLFWTILLPGLLYLSTHGRFAIGMAKPVPVDFSRLRNPKRDMVWVALVGPAANIALAALFSFFWKISGFELILYGAYFNLGLAMFNLIPIPPLDGSRILAGILPLTLARLYMRLEPIGFLIILVVYLSGVLSYVIFPAVDFFCRIFRIPSLTGIA
ncbi:MAG: site-2 protease family protein [Candidatus Omnitrophica bacterium]|nr:site-2 protease family protein [Candidatus Omnitrophota bacterium]